MTVILVVDDDVDFRESVVDTLTDFGFKCEQAICANSAIKLLEKRNYSLIITDILMPGQDGIFLINYLDENKVSSKVIAMSGGGRIGSDSYLEIAGDFGVDGTLKKPFSEEDILLMISSLGIKPQE